MIFDFCDISCNVSSLISDLSLFFLSVTGDLSALKQKNTPT